MIANFAVDSFHGSRPDGLRVTYEPIQNWGGRGEGLQREGVQWQTKSREGGGLKTITTAI
jgi:hypothetical protein